MALICHIGRGEEGMAKSLIFLGEGWRRSGEGWRKCMLQAIENPWRRLAKVGEEENPHTPYARARAREGRARTRLLGVAP